MVGLAEADEALAEADAVAEAEALADGETVGEGDEAVGEGDVALGEGDGDPDGDGDGDGDDEDDEDGEGDGDGDGDGELAAGSAWQLVLVFWDELELVADALGVADAAWALAGQAARPPEISKLPASTLSFVARTCAKRICLTLSALLVLVICALGGSEATR